MAGSFGTNPVLPAWELTPQDLALFASYANRGGVEETSYDDLFDDNIYRTAQTAFRAQGHRLKPAGATHDRRAVEYPGQGIPLELSSAHWEWLPGPKNRRPPAGCGRQRAPPVRAYFFRG